MIVFFMIWVTLMNELFVVLFRSRLFLSRRLRLDLFYEWTYRVLFNG